MAASCVLDERVTADHHRRAPNGLEAAYRPQPGVECDQRGAEESVGWGNVTANGYVDVDDLAELIHGSVTEPPVPSVVL